MGVIFRDEEKNAFTFFRLLSLGLPQGGEGGNTGDCMRARYSYLALIVAAVVVQFHIAAAAGPKQLPTPAVNCPEGRPDEYSELVDKAVKRLVDGDAEGFRELFSSVSIKRTEAALGEGAVDKIIRTRFIPYFANFKKMLPHVDTLPTWDTDKNKGFVILHSFEDTEGNTRSFAIYLINEDDELVVGNLELNKTLGDVTAERKR